MIKRIFIALLVCVFALSGVSSAEKQMALGFQGLEITSNASTLPTLQYMFNPNFVGELGFSFVSEGGTDNYSLALAAKFPLKKTKELRVHWGFGLVYVSNPNLNADTKLTGITVTTGIEWFVLPELSIEGNIAPIGIWTYTNDRGDTTTYTSILNSVRYPAVIIGAHYYI